MAEQLHKALWDLHQASSQSREATLSAAKAMQGVLKQVQDHVRGHNFSNDETFTILDSLVKGGSDGEYRDFAAAEQAIMGVHALVDSLTEAKRWNATQGSAIAAQIKVLYGVLTDQNTYQPAKFSGEMQTLAAALK